jgi:hypothetical protein
MTSAGDGRGGEAAEVDAGDGVGRCLAVHGAPSFLNRTLSDWMIAGTSND